MKMMGICGSSCSFKSTLANALYTKYPNDIAVIRMDDYFKDFSEQDRYSVNLDHPQAVDFELLIDHLQQLKNKQSIHTPVFCDVSQRRTQETKLINPKKMLILEGILIFYPKRLRALLDEKIYIDANESLCLLRKLRRDCQVRRLDLVKVLDSYEHQVYPGYLKYIKPLQQYANMSIKETQFDEMLAALEATFRKYN